MLGQTSTHNTNIDIEESKKLPKNSKILLLMPNNIDEEKIDGNPVVPFYEDPEFKKLTHYNKIYILTQAKKIAQTRKEIINAKKEANNMKMAEFAYNSLVEERNSKCSHQAKYSKIKTLSNSSLSVESQKQIQLTFKKLIKQGFEKNTSTPILIQTIGL